MARTKAFDTTTALDAALDRFWTHGFAATSVRDLASAMGISGPSLYNAFGAKRDLFTRSLDRYLDRTMRARIAALEGAMPPRQALRTFVTEVVDRSLGPDRRGCFLVNSAIDVAPHDPALGAEIAARIGDLEAFFRRLIAAGQSDGTISRRRAPEDLARLLVATVFGIRVLARSKPERALIEGIAATALALLDD